ncbi:hypothetical protein G5V59_24565 [Nocardioides sp. W3-2-3]|nr:hypothetical protein [Nocardioides convexus]
MARRSGASRPATSTTAPTSSPGGWSPPTATRSPARSPSTSAPRARRSSHPSSSRPTRAPYRPSRRSSTASTTPPCCSPAGSRSSSPGPAAASASPIRYDAAWSACCGPPRSWRCSQPLSPSRSPGPTRLGTGASGILDLDALDPSLVGQDLQVLALQAAGLAVAAWAAGLQLSSLVVDLVTALAVWSPALVGHTRAYEPSALLVVTDAVHLSAGAVWLGGLVGLVLTLPAVAGRPRDGALLLTRFSTLAGGLLAALALTGVLMGWRIVGSWSRLFGETYGRLLLVKVALVLVVVAIAAWNRFRLVPRVTEGVGHDDRRRGTGLVRRTVVAEAALLVAVLGVTGFLTQKPPGGEAPATPATADTGVATGLAGDDLKVLAVLDPGPGLQRRLIVQVQNLAGDPLDLYDAPAVALRNDDVDLGEIPVVPDGAGTYVADVVFPTAGRWKAQVSVRVDAFTSPVTTVDLDVSP